MRTFFILDFLERFHGQNVRLESVNYPGYYIRHRNYQCWLDKYGYYGGDDLFGKDSSFTVVKGLSGITNSVSFQSTNYPDHYLANNNGLIRMEDMTHNVREATWMLRGSLWEGDRDTYSISSSIDDRFIRHQGYRIKMHTKDGSDLFKKDASFKIVAV